MVAPKLIPPAEGGLDVGTVDEMRERAAQYQGEADGVDEAAAEVFGEGEQDEDFADLQEETDGDETAA